MFFLFVYIDNYYGISNINIILNRTNTAKKKGSFIKNINCDIIFGETYEIKNLFLVILDNGDRARRVVDHKAAHASHYYPVSIFELN